MTSITDVDNAGFEPRLTTFLSFLAESREAARRRRMARRDRALLAQLADHTLRDIGLARAEGPRHPALPAYLRYAF